MMSIVDDVTTMSVAAEGNAFLLKQQAAKKMAAQQAAAAAEASATSSFAHGVSMAQFEDLVRSVREVEKSVRFAPLFDTLNADSDTTNEYILITVFSMEILEPVFTARGLLGKAI